MPNDAMDIESPMESPKFSAQDDRARHHSETTVVEHIPVAGSRRNRHGAEATTRIFELKRRPERPDQKAADREADQQIQDFTIVRDTSYKSLVRWTRIQAVASIVLGFLAIPLVISSAIQAIEIWRRWHSR